MTPVGEPTGSAEGAGALGDGPLSDGELLEGHEAEPMDERARRKAEAAIDHALIRQALEGDEAGFSGLVERHQRRAYRVARNLVPTDEDAQDLAQEAFLRVFKSLDRFDFGHDFTTWLYRIVTNLCIDFLRKRRAAVSVSGGRGDEDEGVRFDLEDPRQAAPSDHAEALETAAEVEAVLSTLAPHFQSVLTLREIEGLSCPEIAEIVGATHVTVRWRLHRGRKLFQEEWERRSRMRSQGAADLLEGAGAGDGVAENRSQIDSSSDSRGTTPTQRSGARTQERDGSKRSGKKA
ncbi:ECF RNA polymerase sigma factor SigW [Planctomycetes bacterium Poly30]|uniref:RNA polymerase sigma factor n=1 Tax=Saltatorellus ferox TaxID=2528018 RepID=A0A518ERK0_9BACT|nr:ECF RNA polymerase sigma factor SigW [Planctomycetes bacterium Poly30]